MTRASTARQTERKGLPKKTGGQQGSMAEQGQGNPLEVGAVLRQRFEILSHIGKGAHTDVYQARDLIAHQAGIPDSDVALKVLKMEPDTDPDIVHLIHREARRLRNLIHPNIVRVFDMDIDRHEAGDRHYMVMELLQGHTLAKALSAAPSHRLDPSLVEQFVQSIAAALACSHEQHLVHADIKPANVFICKNGQIKLIDFNIAFPIARLEAGDDHTARILGRYGAVTPLYSSPQRLAGEEPSKSDDIFSLATLAYIALTGERPFGDRNAREAKEQGLAPIKPGAIPAATWRVLEKALQFGDEARMQDIREFASAFAAKRTWSLF